MFWRKPCGAAVKDSTLVCFVHVWSAQHQRHSPLYQLPNNWSNIRTMRQLQPCRLSVKNGLMNTTKLSTAQGHVGQLALSVFSQASTKTGCLQTGCSYRLAVQRSAATFAILTHLRFSMVSCTWTMWLGVRQQFKFELKFEPCWPFCNQFHMLFQKAVKQTGSYWDLITVVCVGLTQMAVAVHRSTGTIK